MTHTIGFIGSGAIGGTIARLAVVAGYDVVLSNSRGAESLSELVAELGHQARAAPPNEAARAGDLVVASVPLQAYQKFPVEPLRGKIVIDTMNYYPVRDNQLAVLDSGELTSSELVQQHLKDSKVVKALHNQDAPHLFINATNDKGKRTTLPIAGDDAQAKAKVAEFLDAIGYDAVDAGTLAQSWRIEPGTPIYVWPYAPKVPDGMSRKEAKNFYKNTPGKPVSRQQAEELVAQAERKFPIGGIPDDLPPTWIAIVQDTLREKSKANRN